MFSRTAVAAIVGLGLLVGACVPPTTTGEIPDWVYTSGVGGSGRSGGSDGSSSTQSVDPDPVDVQTTTVLQDPEITFVNNSDRTILVAFGMLDGSNQGGCNLASGGSCTETVPPGTYQYRAYTVYSEVLPYTGQITVVKGSSYTIPFEITF